MYCMMCIIHAGARYDSGYSCPPPGGISELFISLFCNCVKLSNVFVFQVQCQLHPSASRSKYFFCCSLLYPFPLLQPSSSFPHFCLLLHVFLLNFYCTSPFLSTSFLLIFLLCDSASSPPFLFMFPLPSILSSSSLSVFLPFHVLPSSPFTSLSIVLLFLLCLSSRPTFPLVLSSYPLSIPLTSSTVERAHAVFLTV